LLLMPRSEEHSTPQQNKVVHLPVILLLQVTQRPTLLLLMPLKLKKLIPMLMTVAG
jgi:hypothetical protein